MKRIIRLIIVLALLTGSVVAPASATGKPQSMPPAQATPHPAVNSNDQVNLHVPAAVKTDSASPAARVSSLLRAASQSVATLAEAGPFTSSLAGLSTPLVHIDSKGNIEVDVWLWDASPEVLAGLHVSGLAIERSNLDARVVEGWIAYDRITTLAELPGVRLVTPPSYPDVDTGSVNSQGDAIHRANLVRSSLGFNGSGQKVCVLSDGVDHRAAAQATGDLPAVIDVRKAGSGDEGTAMLEIIHDLAPGAALGFYGPSTAVDMANGISILRTAGCTVIVDDLSFNGEPYYQDGQINQAITDVMVNSNVVYAGSAGNVALAHWQGTFVPGTFVSGYGTFHRWAGTDEGLTIQMANGGYFTAYLQWNDPWGGSGNDYDLYLLNSSMSSVLAGSNDTQNGSGNPLEAFFYQNTTGGSIVVNLTVAHWSGSQNARLQIYTRGSGITSRQYNVVAGSITPNHHVTGMFTSAAIDAADAGHDTVESFSSQGPVEHYFPSYQVRSKPDIAGIDGVSVTGAGGFSSPFYGTSAAAPHIAAIAALVRSARPAATRAQIYNWIAAGAVDLGSPGQDNTFGYGRADAYNAVVAATGGTPTPTPTRTRTPTPTPAPVLSTDPTLIPFLAGPGLQPQPATLWVVNTTTVPLNWSASESAAWLTISPLTGTAVLGSPGRMTVTVNTAGLATGIYATDITVSSATAGVIGSPRKVQVRLSNQSTLRRLYLPVILNSRPG
jgi:hypothetical protein